MRSEQGESWDIPDGAFSGRKAATAPTLNLFRSLEHEDTQSDSESFTKRSCMNERVRASQTVEQYNGPLISESEQIVCLLETN